MPSEDEGKIRRIWDNEVIKHTMDNLLNQAPDDYTRARLLAVTSVHSGDWINAQPISSLGLRLNNETIRVAVGLRLGSLVHTAPMFLCSTC